MVHYDRLQETEGLNHDFSYTKDSKKKKKDEKVELDIWRDEKKCNDSY